MALEDDKIKDLFSSKLGNFEPEVPASIWGGLDQLLSQQPPLQAPDPASTTSSSTTAGSSVVGATSKISAIKVFLIAASVAASVAVGVYVVNTADNLEMSPVAEELLDTSHDEELELENDGVVTKPINEIAYADAKVNTQSLARRTLFSTTPPNETLDTNEGEVNIETTIDIKGENEEEKKGESNEEEDILIVEETKEQAPPPLPKFLKEDIALSVRTNAGALNSKVNDRGGDLLFSKNQRSSAFSELLEEENKDYKLEHNQPVSVGITVSKMITPKLSIETGIMFTYLSSKIKSNSAVNIKEKQEFGYLGVPIYLNYTLYELGKANFYLSLGVMAQKDIYGKYTSSIINSENFDKSNFLREFSIPDYVVYSEPVYIKQNISQSHWQFSTHLNLGASYPIYKKFKVYGAIGGAYYFKAGNEYRTVYSDRKFQLDLNLGIGFDF